MLSDYLGTQEKNPLLRDRTAAGYKIILVETSCSQYLAFLSWPEPKDVVLYIKFTCLIGKKSFFPVCVNDG